MRLRERFPGKTRTRSLTGKVCAVSLNRATGTESIILRITLSEDLLSAMNISLGMRVDIDIDDDVMTIYQVDDENRGWKILPSGTSSEHKHGMVVPVLGIKTKPVKSRQVEILVTKDFLVRVKIPGDIKEALSL